MIRSGLVGLVTVAIVCVWGRGAAGATPPGISLKSLLHEMLDRSSVARLPSPWYSCRQFSSYDRESTGPDSPDTWFANRDAGQFLRVETVEGRQEHVLMEADGPGAIVRIWSANPPEGSTLRFYLDGSATPTWEAPFQELLNGKGPVTEPLSAVRARGWNLYLPIPYARGCKVTCDKGGFYYQINYREYEAGTAVESFGPEVLRRDAEEIARVQGTLLAQPPPKPARRSGKKGSIAPGQEAVVESPLVPSGAVSRIVLRVAADDFEQALRSTVLAVEVDGVQTVWCPVGDFFGTGVGMNPYRDWYRVVHEDGTLNALFVMPYSKSCKLKLINLGTQRVAMDFVVHFIEWEWDERSMYFHTTWRQEAPLPTRPMRDWTYASVQGQGVLLGDVLTVSNPVKEWWGEGDEKIYVDGEAFPSHFGTGTEDYYGYAWCSPEKFTAPFHAQPRVDGQSEGTNWGITTVTRTRALDAIPFRSSLKFDMEVWHWKECEVAYAATTYFYARPGATWSPAPAPEEAKRAIPRPPPPPPPFKIEGALECESLKIVAASPGVPAGPQGGFGPGLWSGETQLWVQGRGVGDFVELEIPVEHAGPVAVSLHATRSWDYGVVRFFVNGQRAGEDVDLFNTAGRAVAVTGAIDLGVHTPQDGRLVLRAEVVGGNERAEGTRSFFGLDCVVVTPR